VNCDQGNNRNDDLDPGALHGVVAEGVEGDTGDVTKD
jgi:hypothetical protein